VSRRFPGGPVLFLAVLVVVLVVLIAVLRLAAEAFGAGHGARGDPATGLNVAVPGETPGPELARARAYNRKLERILYRQVTRAERNERRLRRARFVFRRSLGTSPLGNHWLEDAFQCIHRYEAGWGAQTGNGYYGGLQMDRSFMRAYGPEFLRAIGTANHWPRSVQITVAIRGYLERGFQPWPNTRRACGL